MACWDIAGRAAGKPVYELLGGACRPLTVRNRFSLGAYEPDVAQRAGGRAGGGGFRHDQGQGRDRPGPGRRPRQGRPRRDRPGRRLDDRRQRRLGRSRGPLLPGPARRVPAGAGRAAAAARQLLGPEEAPRPDRPEDPRRRELLRRDRGARADRPGMLRCPQPLSGQARGDRQGAADRRPGRGARRSLFDRLEPGVGRRHRRHAPLHRGHAQHAGRALPRRLPRPVLSRVLDRPQPAGDRRSLHHAARRPRARHRRRLGPRREPAAVLGDSTTPCLPADLRLHRARCACRPASRWARRGARRRARPGR